MLDIHLDLLLESLVVFEALLYLEVDEQTQVIVEAQQLLSHSLVAIKFLLEFISASCCSDVC